MSRSKAMLLVIEGDSNVHSYNLLFYLRGDLLLYFIMYLLDSKTMSMLSNKLFLNHGRYNQLERLLDYNEMGSLYFINNRAIIAA